MRTRCSHYGEHITEPALAAWAEYLSFVYDAHHVATHGVKRPGQLIDTGAMESKVPAYDARAMALYKSERRWMDGECAAFLGRRASLVISRLDEIVGEAAA